VLLAPELERAGIELKIEPLAAVFVACSAGVYMSLLGNLVRNAIKYMGNSGPERRITVRVTQRANTVRTEVLDTGPGIPSELHPSLFEPYFRGATRGEAGLGLGLATVRKLALGHGGAVGLASELGHGSAFWFDLPLAGLDLPEPSLHDTIELSAMH
jgi:signal transduction histidine kinase